MSGSPSVSPRTASSGSAFGLASPAYQLANAKSSPTTAAAPSAIAARGDRRDAPEVRPVAMPLDEPGEEQEPEGHDRDHLRLEVVERDDRAQDHEPAGVELVAPDPPEREDERERERRRRRLGDPRRVGDDRDGEQCGGDPDEHLRRGSIRDEERDADAERRGGERRQRCGVVEDRIEPRQPRERRADEARAGLRVDHRLAFRERVAERDDRVRRADDLRDVPEHPAVRRGVELVGGTVQQRTQPAAERGGTERGERELLSPKRRHRRPRARHDGADERRPPRSRRAGATRAAGPQPPSRRTARAGTRRAATAPASGRRQTHEAPSADEPDERREREAERGVQDDRERERGGHGAA